MEPTPNRPLSWALTALVYGIGLGLAAFAGWKLLQRKRIPNHTGPAEAPKPHNVTEFETALRPDGAPGASATESTNGSPGIAEPEGDADIMRMDAGDVIFVEAAEGQAALRSEPTAVGEESEAPALGPSAPSCTSQVRTADEDHTLVGLAGRAAPQPALEPAADTADFNFKSEDTTPPPPQDERVIEAVNAAGVIAEAGAEAERPAEEPPNELEADAAVGESPAEGASASAQPKPAPAPPGIGASGMRMLESFSPVAAEGDSFVGTSDPVAISPEDVGRRATIQRPKKAEDSEEYQALSFSTAFLPADYLSWNRVITRHLLLSSGGLPEAYLSVTPRILACAMAEIEGRMLTPDAAERDFAASVGEVYSRYVLPNSAKLRILRAFAADGLPVCTALLGLSVLSAYRMQTDEDAFGNAYYIRLADLLGCDRVGVHPRGFDPLVFESLWKFTAEWLVRETGCRLAMPPEDVGIRRFIALPLAHVPLRRLDIERLPLFFSWADYQPALRVERGRLASDLRRWAAARNALSPSGASALNDNRRDAVLSQVAGELEAWDGSMPESGGRRTANVEVALDVIRSRPDFTYLPRRPVGFPTTFDDGSRIIQAGEEGFYDSLPLLPECGCELSEGFSWEARLNGATLSLRRKGMVAIPLGPSTEYSGFLSTYGLSKGAPCAVLCHESHSRAAAEFLSEVAEKPCTPIEHRDIPRGWRLFSGVKVRRSLAPPPGLEVLNIRSEAELIFSGGLRLGRRLAWIEGAPPRVVVSGFGPDEQVTIDGQHIEIDEDGTAEVSRALSNPGVHVVAVGQTRKIIETVRPDINMSIVASRKTARVTSVAIPHGAWTVLGAVPGQVASSGAGGAATIWCGPFDPVWAVRVSAGPGAAVMALQDKPALPVIGSPPQGKAQIRRCDGWASVIYNAHIRRPCLHALVGLDPARAAEAWMTYVQLARTIKRSRRGRRW